MTGGKTLEMGFSPDGYIIDQDCFFDFRYRTIPANFNGCGWIAAYNLRRFLGHAVNYDEVRQELDAMHFLRIPGPTLMCVMRKYLSRHVPQYKETVGREAAAAAVWQSRAGIFRYREGHEPHFASYLHLAEDEYRFFNLADGFEDCVLTLGQFFTDHAAPGTVIALTVD